MAVKDKGEAHTKAELAQLEDATLKRLLSMPPQPKPKKEDDASPKKRGRPPKAKTEAG